MTVVIGVDVGHDALRVAALVDDQPELVCTLPSWVAWDGDRVLVGEPARARPAGEHLGRLPSWLERTTDDGERGGGPGPLTSVWPRVGGELRPPAEAVAWLLRAAAVAVEERHGPVLGAVFAIDPTLGVVARRALRDAAAIAGIPSSRLVAAPACAALVVPGAVDGGWLVCDAGAGALSITVLERVGGAIHSLAQIRDVDLGGDALDTTIADQLDLEGDAATIDSDDPAWPALCALARAIKEGAGAETIAALEARLGGARVKLPARDEVDDWLAARLRRLDELIQRALAGSGFAAADLGDALLIGGGARLPGVPRRLQHALGRAPRVAGDPGSTAVLGAAAAARMFLTEPAALFLDVVTHPLALSDGHGLEPLIAAGTIAPTRALRVVATEQAEQEQLDVELWEQGPRTRPYARYTVGGLPAAPAGDAIATCDVMIDADLLPRLAARELVTGHPLAVAATAEAAIDAGALAALRERVTAWRP
ncbi:MAG TPA: Hsp70 family protein [Kofleriaceae bacterium]|nr:Hsp70 family protein [Kofleriaceae bacterium]